MINTIVRAALTYCFPLTLKDMSEVLAPETAEMVTFLHSGVKPLLISAFFFLLSLGG